MSRTTNYANAIVENSLRAKSGDEAAIFTDESCLIFANDLAEVLVNNGAEVTIFVIPESIRPFLKLTDIQASALISSDIVIYVLATESSIKDLSQEVAFRHFLITIPLQHKGRVCMMPGFVDDMKAAVSIDYDKLRQKSETLKRMISGRNIRITSKLGTDVSFSLGNRNLKIDDGDISKAGSFGNIPAGEIFTAPVEETVTGKIVIDGSIGGIGLVKTPFVLHLEAGQIKKMKSVNAADDVFQRFSKICEYDVPATKTLGEFGIGLNPNARIIGKMLLDEKVEGTVHFAFGDSYGLGKSTSKYHTDLLVKNPTIIINEDIIMDEGRFLLTL